MYKQWDEDIGLSYENRFMTFLAMEKVTTHKAGEYFTEKSKTAKGKSTG